MNRWHLTLVFIFVLIVSCIFMDSQSCLATTGEKKVLRIIVHMSPAKVIYEQKAEKKVKKPIFDYDPTKDLMKSLRKAGFVTVSKDTEKFDMSLEVNYAERIAKDPLNPAKKVVFTSDLTFVLKDKKGNIMLKWEEGWGVFEGTKDAKLFVNELLPGFLTDRLKAVDEVQFIVQYTKRYLTGARCTIFSETGIQRLGEIEDPRTINTLRTLLRAPYHTCRKLAMESLSKKGYKPQSPKDKAALELVRPTSGGGDIHRHIKLISKYDLTAIDLFLDDLKCESKRRYFEQIKRETYDNPVPEKAKMALCVIAQHKWKRWMGGWNQEWNVYVVPRLIEALKSENNDVKYKDNYLGDIIDILGEISDQRAIEPLEKHLTHPKLAAKAKKAIHRIKKRGM